jgi:hypothetical protein
MRSAPSRTTGLRDRFGIVEPEVPANSCERFLADGAVLDMRAHNHRRLRAEFVTRKCLQIALARTASPFVHGSRPSQPWNEYGLSPRAGPNATGKPPGRPDASSLA